MEQHVTVDMILWQEIVYDDDDDDDVYARLPKNEREHKASWETFKNTIVGGGRVMMMKLLYKYIASVQADPPV
ncbi:MAG: hypothetical protein FJ333_09935 [Sphingomonadales bacterium]|nr:hypothetical protein [Sphingomonadales bacterium]